jgi:hypothetical protein
MTKINAVAKSDYSKPSGSATYQAKKDTSPMKLSKDDASSYFSDSIGDGAGSGGDESFVDIWLDHGKAVHKKATDDVKKWEGKAKSRLKEDLADILGTSSSESSKSKTSKSGDDSYAGEEPDAGSDDGEEESFVDILLDHAKAAHRKVSDDVKKWTGKIKSRLSEDLAHIRGE